MALVVEDGTGLADADAFISLVAFKAYCDAQGYDYSDYDDTDIEAAIRRGTNHISGDFSWRGTRLTGRTQALSWPRSDVTDSEGWTVPDDALPSEIVKASAEASWYELDTGPLKPAFVPAAQAKREKVGSIEVEYVITGSEGAQPVLPILRALVGPLLLAEGANGLVGVAVRA